MRSKQGREKHFMQRSNRHDDNDDASFGFRDTTPTHKKSFPSSQLNMPMVALLAGPTHRLVQLASIPSVPENA